MSSRQRATLDEVCSLIADCPHSTPVWTESGYLVIRNQNIKNGKLDLSERSYTDHEHYLIRIRRAKPQYGDLILTREAPMGEVCMVPQGLECCVGQRQVLLRPNPEKVVPRFLLYAIQSPEVQHEISWSEGTGSTVSNIRIPVLKNIRIPLLPLKQQDAIASLLGALDDRIALLRETNATLEAIAQALFKSWFVDFDPVHARARGEQPEGLPEPLAALFPDSFEESPLGLVPRGWRVGELGEILALRNERTQPSDETKALPYVPIESIGAKTPFLAEFKPGEDANSSLILFKEGDILFGAMRPYFHKVCIAPFDGVTRTTVFTLSARNAEARGFALFLTYQDVTVEYATQHSEGSTIPYAKWKNSLERMPVLIPPDAVQEVFSEVVNSFVGRANANIQQAQTLASLRDTLLPRLISGQLRLPETKEQLEESLA